MAEQSPEYRLRRAIGPAAEAEPDHDDIRSVLAELDAARARLVALEKVAVAAHAVPPSVQTRLIAIREDIKYGYSEHAAYLARLATGWGPDA